MARASWGLRAHSRVSDWALARAASAVPQLPAPRTATRTRVEGAVMEALLACRAWRQYQARIFLALFFRQLGHPLLVQTLEIDLGQVQRGQRGAVDGIGDVGAQVGVQHGG